MHKCSQPHTLTAPARITLIQGFCAWLLEQANTLLAGNHFWFWKQHKCAFPGSTGFFCELDPDWLTEQALTALSYGKNDHEDNSRVKTISYLEENTIRAREVHTEIPQE